jgi:hypothetical protein
VKFFIYVSVCLCLLIYAAAVPLKPQLYYYGGEYCIYSRDNVVSPLISRRVDFGLGYIYYCDSANAEKLRVKFKNIDGESIVIKDKIKYESILQKFALHKTDETFDGIYKTIYAKNERYGTVQIVVRANDIVVGYPAILGSY